MVEKIDLSLTNVTDVANLSGCGTLKKLLLGSCKGLTDEGILGLERIPTLEELYLGETNITATCPPAGR